MQTMKLLSDNPGLCWAGAHQRGVKHLTKRTIEVELGTPPNGPVLPSIKVFSESSRMFKSAHFCPKRFRFLALRPG
jgi:hypothetical protein